MDNLVLEIVVANWCSLLAVGGGYLMDQNEMELWSKIPNWTSLDCVTTKLRNMKRRGCMCMIGVGFGAWWSTAHGIQLSCVSCICYSGVARTQPMPGHSVGTLRLRRTQAPPSLSRCLGTAWAHYVCAVPRPRPALSRLQYGMQKQLGGSGGCSPRKFWNFWAS